ncbi:hypothetical protein SACS_0238 [Parasaccharibacter apium]|uniref:Uncharacterized protein n=1 Tax=Parasaccharibacter apium TaxID=1510841 RepID=A0A7U7J0B0_9PROT|nr:hypothetical protein SACS_0238 [Parasaccharibacter apium]
MPGAVGPLGGWVVMKRLLFCWNEKDEGMKYDAAWLDTRFGFAKKSVSVQ